MSFVETLYPDVAIQAPGIPDPVIERQILLGAQQFLKESEAWQPRLGEFLTYSVVQEFDIPLPRDTRIARVLWVNIEGRPIEPIEMEDIEENRRAGFHILNETQELLLSQATPRGWTRVHAAIYPESAATDLPLYLTEDFRNELVASALARMYSMPKTAWHDDAQAMKFANVTASGILSAKRLSNNRRAGKARKVRYGGIG